MFQFMERHQPYSYVSSVAEGIRRVQEEDYAFLMESTMIEYETSQVCNLTQVGGLIDSKDYGIGLRKGVTFDLALSFPYTELCVFVVCRLSIYFLHQQSHSATTRRG